jgi:hypothetical protein
VSKDQVKDAPSISEGELSQQKTASCLSIAASRTGPSTDDAMTRSDEELLVGKAQRENASGPAAGCCCS